MPVGAFSQAVAAGGGGSGDALEEDTHTGDSAGAQSSTPATPFPAQDKGRQGASGSMGRDEVTPSLGCARGSWEEAGVLTLIQQYLDSGSPRRSEVWVFFPLLFPIFMEGQHRNVA